MPADAVVEAVAAATISYGSCSFFAAAETGPAYATYCRYYSSSTAAAATNLLTIAAATAATKPLIRGCRKHPLYLSKIRPGNNRTFVSIG